MGCAEVNLAPLPLCAVAQILSLYHAGERDAASSKSIAVAEVLARADGRARLLVKAMAAAERVGTRFYSLRQARACSRQRSLSVDHCLYRANGLAGPVHTPDCGSSH